MKPIAFYPKLAQELGSIEAAIYYQQLHYWSDKGYLEDGWIYKTKKEIEDETTIPARTQDRIRAKLEEMGWLEVKIAKAGGVPTTHYKCLKEYTFSITPNLHNRLRQNGVMESDKMAQSSIQRIHTESTYTSKAGQKAGVKALQTKNDGKDIAEVIKTLEAIDKKNKLYYGNKTQRAACDFLLTEYGLTAIKDAVNFYQQAKGKVEYLPVISSPVQLRDKWTALEAVIQRKIAKNSSGARQVV